MLGDCLQNREYGMGCKLAGGAYLGIREGVGMGGARDAVECKGQCYCVHLGCYRWDCSVGVHGMRVHTGRWGGGLHSSLFLPDILARYQLVKIVGMLD